MRLITGILQSQEALDKGPEATPTARIKLHVLWSSFLNKTIMETEASSPTRKRAMESEPLSPKRARLDLSHTDSLQPTADASNPGTPFDDVDDLYGTPLEPPHKPYVDHPEATKPTKISQAIESKKPFSLPGLGQAVQEHKEGNASPTIPTQAVSKTANASKFHLNDIDSIHDVRGTQGEGLESQAVHTNNQVALQIPKKDVLIDNHGDGTDLATEKNTGNLAFSAATISEAEATEPSFVSRKEDIAKATQASSIFNPHEDIDVASLSEKLPFVATDNAQVEDLTTHRSSIGYEIIERAEIAHPAADVASQTNDYRRATLSRELSDARTSEKADPQDQIMEDLVETRKPMEEAEFGTDSSPVDSSASDSSSDSGSSDDSDDYELLSPEEQARRLMQEDIGSEDEGPGKGRNGTLTGPLRTENERADDIVSKPDLVVTPEMKVQELGDVDLLVENQALIKAKISGEYQVLESGSVLCLGDRSVIGVVAETLGRVQQPYYSVRFTNAAAIAEAGLSKGTTIFYVEQHSTTVFTQPLKAYKGSDASNLHDEEVGDDELEFSDDEKEAEHRRKLKQAKQARREGRVADSDGFSKGPGRGNDRHGNNKRGRSGQRGARSDRGHRSYGVSETLDYGDLEVDGPYNPLSRPTNLHEMMGINEAPTESRQDGGSSHRGNCGGRGPQERARGSGRGDRGRGWRDGRGSQRNHRDHNAPTNRHLVAPRWNDAPQAQDPPLYGSAQQQNSYILGQHPSQPVYAFDHGAQTQPDTTPFNYNNNHQQFPAPQYYQNFQPQSPQSSIPPGAFVNPAFFAQASRGNRHAAHSTYDQN